MLYITQLIYIHAGQEAAFNEFEGHAIPIIARYNGELLLRIRPGQEAFVQVGTIEKPDEIHLICFQSETDFAAFLADEERKKYLHLKEQSIRVSFLIKGEVL
tara:strand:- start:348 stop:653 length:306 start_codon:yes stop_codon:yes gene_type:complete